jgi:hypothetical protein
LRQINQYGGADVFLSDAPDGRHRFVFAGQWTGAGHRGRWYVGDFNGDGADDLLRQVNEYGGAEVFLSDAPNGRNRFVFAGQWTGDGNRGLGWYVGDFDGDSDDDIFRQQNEWGGAEVFLADRSRQQFICHGCGEDGWYWSGHGHSGYGWYLGDFDGRGPLPGIPAIDIFRQINEWGGAEVFLSSGFLSYRFACAERGENLLAGTYTGTVTGPDGSAPATLTLGQAGTQVTVTGSLTGPLTINPGAICGGNQTVPAGTVLGPVTATESSPGVVTGPFQVQIGNNIINGTLALTLDPSGHSLAASVDLDLPFPCSNQSLTGAFTRP